MYKTKSGAEIGAKRAASILGVKRSLAREIVARAAGYRDWHHLTTLIGRESAPIGPGDREALDAYLASKDLPHVSGHEVIAMITPRPSVITPIEMHEHGDPEMRERLKAEPFPAIRREIVQFASDVGSPHVKTFTSYTLGGYEPGDGVVGMSTLDRFDPKQDEPMCLMIIAHPLGTDVEKAAAALHSMAYWRGSIYDAPMMARQGEDRIWTLHKFPPIPGTASHVIIRRGFDMQSIETLDGAVVPWDYDKQVRSVREQNGEGVHWHRHYASDAPVPGTALHSPDRRTEDQLAEWFAHRLAVRLPDGTEQIVLGTQVELKGAGGVAYSAIRRGRHVMAHRCKFAFSPGDIFDDTLTWTASYESSGWDEPVFPASLAAMLTLPASPSATGWRSRAGLA